MTTITEAHVEKLLGFWGEEHQRSDGVNEGHRLVLVSALAEVTVDRTRENEIRKVLSRTARARVARRLIVQRMREKGEKGHVPAWAGGDPVRCKETRVATGSRWVMAPMAERVERWVVGLGYWDPRAALALRAHYCRGEKTGRGAAWVQRASGLPVGRHGYIAALARGRLHIARCAAQEIGP